MVFAIVKMIFTAILLTVVVIILITPNRKD